MRKENYEKPNEKRQIEREAEGLGDDLAQGVDGGIGQGVDQVEDRLDPLRRHPPGLEEEDEGEDDPAQQDRLVGLEDKADRFGHVRRARSELIEESPLHQTAPLLS